MARMPEPVEGRPRKPVLLGDGTAPVQRPTDFLVFHWPHYQHQKQSTPDTTIIAHGWKLHYWWETDSVQLFHLDQDLAESKDLASAEPARTAEMWKIMLNYLASIQAQLSVPNPDYKPSDYAPDNKKRTSAADQKKNENKHSRPRNLTSRSALPIRRGFVLRDTSTTSICEISLEIKHEP